MAKLMGLVAIVGELRTQRTSLVNQLRHVDRALSALGNLNGSMTNGKRNVSAASRKRMSLAQKARWGRVATNGATAKPVRRMSATARRKIAKAQRARWAKLKTKKAA